VTVWANSSQVRFMEEDRKERKGDDAGRRRARAGRRSWPDGPRGAVIVSQGPCATRGSAASSQDPFCLSIKGKP
jgi:hypothetical protein